MSLEIPLGLITLGSFSLTEVRDSLNACIGVSNHVS